MSKKPWEGRFRARMNQAFERFSESVSFDQKLALYDLQADLAQVEMLKRIGLLKGAEAQKLIQGLKKIQQEIKQGKFKFKPELEDVHMNIEHRLFQLCGEVAGKLHIGRSRNDLVACDLRLWLKEEIKKVNARLRNLISALVEKAEKHLEVIMPGYTHTRPAQPILFSHWLLAYAWMLVRDRERFIQTSERADACPLGSGALAGVNFPFEREFLAQKLGFSRITENSLDAVSDRDFLIEFLFNSSLLMMHLSRLSEELVWMSGEEFGFFQLPEELCTGSSMMPNKKNPDALELIRGKTGRCYGNLISLLTVMKSTPLAYNRDFQEDKEAVFDSAQTVNSSLEITELVIRGLKPVPERMLKACQQGYILATDLADYLVQKGLGFRQAHRAVGRLVRYCEEKGKTFEQLSLKEFKKAHPLFGQEVYELLSFSASVQSKNVPGATSPAQVRRSLRKLKLILRKWE
ncbi:argininosuccinate lyase [bacterium]|nr:argininosuccinate lyase [bacterium]